MIPRLVRFALLSAAIGVARLAAAEEAPAFPPETYAAVGSQFAQNSGIAVLGWTDLQFEAFLDGMRATFRGKPYPFDSRAQQLNDTIGRRVQEHMRHMEQTRFSRPGEIERYMKEAAAGLQLERSDSGLAYGLMERAGGTRPGPDDTVVVSYTAVGPDGQTELPQISVKQRKLKVSELLPGLAEGVQMLALSGSALLVLPPDLSYGTGTWPEGITPGSPLIFSLKLEEIIAAP